MATRNNRDTQAIRDQKLIAGIEKDLASTPSLTVGTKSVTPAQVVSTLQTRLAKADATAQALAAYHAAVKDERDTRASTAKLIAAFKRVVEGMFYDSPNLLADFGLKPVTRAKQTVASKAAAIQKGQATKAGHHTVVTSPPPHAAEPPATATKPTP